MFCGAHIHQLGDPNCCRAAIMGFTKLGMFFVARTYTSLVTPIVAELQS
jgi:hypothetical protein